MMIFTILFFAARADIPVTFRGRRAIEYGSGDSGLIY